MCPYLSPLTPSNLACSVNFRALSLPPTTHLTPSLSGRLFLNLAQECLHYPKYHCVLQGRRRSSKSFTEDPLLGRAQKPCAFLAPIPLPFPPHPHPLVKFALQTCRTPFCAGPRKQEGRKRTGQRKQEHSQAPDKPAREELLKGKNVAA